MQGQMRRSESHRIDRFHVEPRDHVAAGVEAEHARGWIDAFRLRLHTGQVDPVTGVRGESERPLKCGGVRDGHLPGAVGEIDMLARGDCALDRKLPAAVERHDAAPAKIGDTRVDIGEAFNLDHSGGGDVGALEMQRALLADQDEGAAQAIRENEVAVGTGIDGKRTANGLDKDLAFVARRARAEQSGGHGVGWVTTRHRQGLPDDCCLIGSEERLEGRRVRQQRDGRAAARATQCDLLAADRLPVDLGHSRGDDDGVATGRDHAGCPVGSVKPLAYRARNPGLSGVHPYPPRMVVTLTPMTPPLLCYCENPGARSSCAPWSLRVRRTGL
jgi:hypothetical protein